MIPATRVEAGSTAGASQRRGGLWSWNVNGWRTFLARRREVLASAGIPDDSLKTVSAELSSLSSPEPADRSGGDLLLFALAKESREQQLAAEEQARAASAEAAKP